MATTTRTQNRYDHRLRELVRTTQDVSVGTHAFSFMAWDVIRAVDYLVSRPEVDPARIACTGCSGGGMMTTYILPFEPRITVDVPTYRNDILVTGILKRLDLPQFYQAGFPRRVTLINPLRGDQRPASGGEITAAYQHVSKTYESLGQPAGWRVFAQINERERPKRIMSAFITP